MQITAQSARPFCREAKGQKAQWAPSGEKQRTNVPRVHAKTCANFTGSARGGGGGGGRGGRGSRRCRPGWRWQKQQQQQQ